jgi:hypothetical protein
MNTTSELGRHTHTHTHTRTEGRAPARGSEFATKAATLQGNSAEFVPGLCVVALGPVAARARVLVQEAARAEELANRRL